MILVDVGGLSGDNGLYESLGLLRELTHMFRPRLKAIIIKSACVRTFSQQMITAGRWVYLEKAMAAQREARKKEKEKGQEKETEETKEETKATDR